MSELFAIASAVCIAISGMLISELGGRVNVFRLARWQMTSSFVMTAASALIVGQWQTIARWQFELLAVSSLFGIIIGSTAYFAAIFTAGPRVTALLFSLTSPFAVILGYLVLGETIDLKQAGGIVLVLGGILLAVGLPSQSSGATTRIPWYGIVFGIITSLGQAVSSLLARPAMASGVDPFAAMAIRSGVAALFFIALAPLPYSYLRKPSHVSVQALAIAIASSLFGTGFGMVLLMQALATGHVGIVSTLSSMTPVLILPMVWLRSQVPPPPRAWAGAALAVAGTALISL